MRKAFQCVVSFLAGVSVGTIVMLVNKDQKIKKLLRLSQKLENIVKIYSFWIMSKVSYSEYLKKLGINKIAIYGIGYLGKSLVDELQNSCIEILYAIDRNLVQYHSELKVIKLDEIKEIPDMVIITAIDNYEEIKKTIEEKIKCKIVSIEDLIYQFIE